MKLLFRFSIAITLLIIITVLSCTRKSTDYIGPAYISAPEGFAVISFTSSVTTADFNPASAVTFDAAFTSSVSWTLTLTGQTSGAVRVFQGISNGFAGLQWFGEHDGVYFFRKDENVTATLSFFGTTTMGQTPAPITITEAPVYTVCGGKFSRYGDFEDATKITGANNWFPFSNPTTPIANVDQGVASAAIDYTGHVVPSVEGKQYYYIKGLGAQPTFVSGMQYTRTSSFTGLPADASQVWVNIYLYGTGDPNAGVELEYQESDIDGAPGYQGTDDDAFVARITLNHKGWKLFSFKYSDLTPSLNADFGGSGNKIHEPDRLRSWDIVVVKKTNANSPIEVYFDYPIISVGGPFKPCH